MLQTSQSNSWIIQYQSSPQAKLRLFCFPYAGGGASIFRGWFRELPSWIEVFGIQLPGRENRLKEPLFTDMASLMKQLIPNIHGYLDRPFAFFGYSLGALISYELACQLRSRQLPMPIHLYVAAREAPHIPTAEPIYQLTDKAFIEQLCRYGGMPEFLLQNEELLELFLPILRADFTVNETYSYIETGRLNCPISVFGGLQDTTGMQDELEAWSHHTSRQFNLTMLPGDHFFFRSHSSLLFDASGVRQI